METWHPFAVHLPIALVVLWPVLDVLGLLSKRPDLALGGVILLGASVPATLFATVTGQAAYDAAIAAGISPAVLETHVDRGELVPWIMLIVFVLRVLGPKKWGQGARWLALALGVLGIALVTAVGYSGGKLVYDEGVGVRLYREKASR